jgi:tRNA-2-methylthio-N6-dimethylallyladenosine synthase
MHRGYNRSRYMDRLDLARRSIPDLAVTTDIIVGFPGESDEDFDATMDVVEAARFDAAFMFIFSPRPGTSAAEMEADFVHPDVIQRRFDRLAETQNRISGERNEELVGRTAEVLAEGPSKKDPDMATTRTRGGKVVHVPGQIPVGTFLEVEIVRARQHHLIGRAV